MKTLDVRIRNVAALWGEISDLMRVHYRVSEIEPFVQRYPEIYHIYLMLRERLEQVPLVKGK